MWRTYGPSTCPLHVSCVVHPRLDRLSQVHEYTTKTSHHVSWKFELLPTHWHDTYTVPFLVKILIWKSHREPLFVHAGFVPVSYIYVCKLMLKSSIIFTYQSLKLT